MSRPAPFRLLVVGLGSIGRRHLAAAAELGWDVAAVSRRPGAGAEFPTFAAIAPALAAFAPDGVLIATETARHGDDIRALAAAGYHGPLLVEKPLTAAADEAPPALLATFSRVHCAYVLRFHPLMTQFRAHLAQDAPARLISAHAGQHLASWRPGADFRTGYSASQAAGGGVLRDLSHELDYLIWLFGAPASVAAQGGNFGLLGIDADEAWHILLRFAGGACAQLEVNYLDRTAARWASVQTPAHEWRLDFKAGAILRDGAAAPGGVGAPEDGLAPANRMYRDQLRAFAAADPALASAQEAAGVVALIETIERANREKKWIDL